MQNFCFLCLSKDNSYLPPERRIQSFGRKRMNDFAQNMIEGNTEDDYLGDTKSSSDCSAIGFRGCTFYRSDLKLRNYFLRHEFPRIKGGMTHGQLVRLAERWLRRLNCRIVLSEQTADFKEVPDVIGWRMDCRSTVVECKVSRSDFAADRRKRARQKPELAMGCQRFYLTPAGLLRPDETPPGWGLLEATRSGIQVLAPCCGRSQRKEAGLIAEMTLLLASLRRVEVRIEPQTITEFLKWKHRMAAYNGGSLPKELVPVDQELDSAPMLAEDILLR